MQHCKSLKTHAAVVMMGVHTHTHTHTEKPHVVTSFSISVMHVEKTVLSGSLSLNESTKFYLKIAATVR